MKKLFSLSLLLVLVSATTTITAMDAKKMAKKQACKKAYEDCKKKADGNTPKMMACKAAYEKCLKECK